MKILIVDDSCEIREILKFTIKRHGHEVIEAEEGQEGYEKAKTYRPDLVVTDALMPGVDGFTMLRNIKKDPRTHHIPCVFYSSIYTGNNDRELAVSLGAETFISKPKRPEDIWTEINPILERKIQNEAGTDKKLLTDEKEFLKSYSSVVTAKLEEKVKELENDIARRKQIEEILRNIAEGVSATTGESFFRSLVLYVAKVLHIDYVLVGELTHDNKQVETVAVCAYNKIVDNFVYNLAGTPCAQVIKREYVCIRVTFSHNFPMITCFQK